MKKVLPASHTVRRLALPLGVLYALFCVTLPAAEPTPALARLLAAPLSVDDHAQ